MITSSILNSVTFKDLSSGTFPNKWNRLHEDNRGGGFSIIPYCQKFNHGDIIYLQFTSDSDVAPTLKIYNPGYKTFVTGTLASSYIGDYSRYFYNFEITLNSDYYGKKIYFTCEQGTTLLTSEPIFCTDLSEAITKGHIKRLKYTNLDRNESDLSDRWVDWSAIDYMYFYVESVDVDLFDSENVEVLEGSQSKTIISAVNYSGIQLKTDVLPDYMVLKLKAASNLDYFEVNEIQYVKEGESESERVQGSTSFQMTINLIEKNTIGLNVDDLGITFVNGFDMAIIPKRNTGVTAAGWQVENPEGYMLHSVFIKHATTSAGDAVVKLGTTVSGDELIDEVQGSISRSEFSTEWATFSRHYLKDPDNSSQLYFSVSGAGAVLDIIVNFDTVTES